MVFIETSFSVFITNTAIRHALMCGAVIEVVDPNPIDIGIPDIVYHKMSAQEFIASDPS